MKALTQSTRPESSKQINRKWHVIDVKGEILGRVTNRIATLLIGKNKVNYAPNLDMGDYVIVINSTQVEVTGSKKTDKIYQNYSGYPGGLREVRFERVMQDNPERIIREAVSGMLPKNKLRKLRLSRLYIYPGDKHPHQVS